MLEEESSKILPFPELFNLHHVHSIDQYFTEAKEFEAFEG